MPYRAMLMTLVTVAIALLAVTLWISAVAPLVAHTPGAVAPATRAGGTDPATMPSQNLRRVFQGTLVLAFVLVCMLLLVGFAATLREWVRLRTSRREKAARKTTYVDAWKVAGERLPPPPPDETP